jgi:hypothetical protein
MTGCRSSVDGGVEVFQFTSPALRLKTLSALQPKRAYFDCTLYGWIISAIRR